ncbi:hypothetical protein HOG98_05585 [bacterium]|jgi:hypothetical protein|nr:hypothetical protein [bacterium]
MKNKITPINIQYLEGFHIQILISKIHLEKIYQENRIATDLEKIKKFWDCYEEVYGIKFLIMGKANNRSITGLNNSYEAVRFNHEEIENETSFKDYSTVKAFDIVSTGFIDKNFHFEGFGISFSYDPSLDSDEIIVIKDRFELNLSFCRNLLQSFNPAQYYLSKKSLDMKKHSLRQLNHRKNDLLNFKHTPIKLSKMLIFLILIISLVSFIWLQSFYLLPCLIFLLYVLELRLKKFYKDLNGDREIDSINDKIKLIKNECYGSYSVDTYFLNNNKLHKKLTDLAHSHLNDTKKKDSPIIIDPYSFESLKTDVDYVRFVLYVDINKYWTTVEFLIENPNEFGDELIQKKTFPTKKLIENVI